MRNALLALALLTATGCHEVCGTTSPIWVQADCAIGPVPPDTGLDDCDLVLEMTVDDAYAATVDGQAEVALLARVTNLTGDPVSFTVYEPCPDDLASFWGLGDGYDYYGTCMAGVCVDTGERVVETVAAGETVEVATTVALGGDSCNDAVVPGTYALTFALPLTDDPQPAICGPEAVTLTVQ